MIAFALIATLVASAPAVPPQVSSDPLTHALYEQLSHGLPPAAVGQWVTYALHGNGRAGDAYWRLAIVGKAKDEKGRDAVWMEMELDQHPNFVAPLFQMKMLVASSGGLHADGITRAILAIGAGKPQEVDPASLASQAKKSGAAPAPGSHTVMVERHPLTLRAGKAQKLMTAAGTVDATPVEAVYRRTVIERYWISKEIPVLQLAKIEIPNLDDAMEVRDYGIDAKPMLRFPDPDAPKISLETQPASNGGTDEPAPASP